MDTCRQKPPQVVAVKSKSLGAWDAVLQEVCILQHVRHPHVVRLVDIFCGYRWRLVLEFGQDLSLHPGAKTWSIPEKVDLSDMHNIFNNAFDSTG